MKKPQVYIGLLAALGTAIGVLVAVVGLPYGRLNYSAFASQYHSGDQGTPGPTNAPGIHFTIQCPDGSNGPECFVPVTNTSNLLFAVTIGNNGPATTLRSFNVDVVQTDNNPGFLALAAGGPGPDPNKDANPDANQAGYPTFGCALPAPSAINGSPAGGGTAELVCFSGAADGPALPTSVTHLKLMDVIYVDNATVAGTVHIKLANVAASDNSLSEIGSCNPGIDVPVQCYDLQTSVHFFFPPTNTPAPPTNTPTPAPPTNTPQPTNTPTNTATATATVAGANVNKIPEGNANNVGPGPSANLFLCKPNFAPYHLGADPLSPAQSWNDDVLVPPETCAGPNEGDLLVLEHATGVATDPLNTVAGLGAYEFSIEYDNFVIQSVNPCDVVFNPVGAEVATIGGAGAARGNVDQINAPANNSHCPYDVVRAGVPLNGVLGGKGLNGTCTMSAVLENIIHFGCVTSGTLFAGPLGTMDLAVLDLIPNPDLANDICPCNNNGVVTILKDNGCELVDIFGHAVLGSVNGGLTPVCGDLAVTVRILEGDLNLDCKVDAADAQLIAFRYGSFFGMFTYIKWFDLEPAGHDLDIDIKDLQKVFGRDGSTCQIPIPAQPPLPFPY